MERENVGKRFLEITPELQSFIEEQSLFFVGSAPLSANGHVNVSPKGLDTFRALGPRRVAYLDLAGSGIESKLAADCLDFYHNSSPKVHLLRGESIERKNCIPKFHCAATIFVSATPSKSLYCLSRIFRS
jgi:hypothetical protein